MIVDGMSNVDGGSSRSCVECGEGGNEGVGVSEKWVCR